jgi:hypothetical protein
MRRALVLFAVTLSIPLGGAIDVTESEARAAFFTDCRYEDY